MTSRTKKILIIILSVLFVVLIAGGYFGYRIYRYVYAPNVIVKSENYFLKIPTGSDFEDVVTLLSEKQLLNDVESFRWVADKKNYGSRVKPGRYQLKNGMSNNELINLLRSGAQTPVRLSFISVRTLEQLAGKVGGVIEADSLELIQCFRDTATLNRTGFNENTLIAMFIPDTYEFFWNTSAEQFVGRMKEEYDKFWNSDRIAKADATGLSLVEVSTLASIVEQETRMNDEKARIAGVYINRLERGELLQADPTVIYAVGDFSIQRVLFRHLEYDSPYNTYMYAGLPPGPICVPSPASIDAVLNYERHEYMFFCAKEDFSGYHNFAKTLRQHNVNARRFQNALNQRNIR